MQLRRRLAIGVATLGFFVSGPAWAQVSTDQSAEAPQGEPDVVKLESISDFLHRLLPTGDLDIHPDIPIGSEEPK